MTNALFPELFEFKTTCATAQIDPLTLNGWERLETVNGWRRCVTEIWGLWIEREGDKILGYITKLNMGGVVLPPHYETTEGTVADMAEWLEKKLQELLKNLGRKTGAEPPPENHRT
jgi:hypothetical protein